MGKSYIFQTGGSYLPGYYPPIILGEPFEVDSGGWAETGTALVKANSLAAPAYTGSKAKHVSCTGLVGGEATYGVTKSIIRPSGEVARIRVAALRNTAEDVQIWLAAKLHGAANLDGTHGIGVSTIDNAINYYSASAPIAFSGTELNTPATGGWFELMLAINLASGQLFEATACGNQPATLPRALQLTGTTPFDTIQIYLMILADTGIAIAAAFDDLSVTVY